MFNVPPNFTWVPNAVSSDRSLTPPVQAVAAPDIHAIVQQSTPYPSSAKRVYVPLKPASQESDASSNSEDEEVASITKAFKYARRDENGNIELPGKARERGESPSRSLN